jgi:hypothetical protein
MKLALFAVAAVAAPLLLMRRRLLLRYFGFAAALWLVFGFLSVVLRPLRMNVDGDLAMVMCSVLHVALIWFLVATAEAFDVRWSATRAAAALFVFLVAAVPVILRTPPDGDEAYYILIAESIVHDRDLDLSNQYQHLDESVTRRTDLKPQLGDSATRSRLEPFLSILLVPGLLIGKLYGILITMALFGALLARSTIRMLEDELIPDSTIRALFPLVALGPPILFYSLRVWPEVPAAFFLVEAVRGIRARRSLRWIPAILALVLLKLRFVLVAAVLLARAAWKRRQFVIGAAIVVSLLTGGWLLAGNAHRARELIPGSGFAMLNGLFGLALDGMAGIVFQAPLYLFGLIALARWRRMPASFRLGMSASSIYIFYLVQRAEWHGGWSPPLRYVVVFMPFLALGCAVLWERLDRGAIALVVASTIGLVVHGLAYPWRLFHIANGENFIGENLSMIWGSDFSRLFPSFIRPNIASYVASAILVIVLVAFRTGRSAAPPIAFAIALVLAFEVGRISSDRIEFEDAHVTHAGGALYPETFQVQRFLYRGGWIVRAGDSISFLARQGPMNLEYQSQRGATIQLGARAYDLPPTGQTYGITRVNIPSEGRIELRGLAGAVNLDRMTYAGR